MNFNLGATMKSVLSRGGVGIALTAIGFAGQAQTAGDSTLDAVIKAGGLRGLHAG